MKENEELHRRLELSRQHNEELLNRNIEKTKKELKKMKMRKLSRIPK
jgi:hypothetical protein